LLIVKTFSHSQKKALASVGEEEPTDARAALPKIPHYIARFEEEEITSKGSRR
jgi:hypothetical protein